MVDTDTEAEIQSVEEPIEDTTRERTERAERAEREDRAEAQERAEPRERAEPFSRGPAITRAIQHVQEVIDDLKRALDEMELALELLEEAERQKLDDEREIKALQKALERVNRFRGGRSSERSERGQD
jgi:hypothetical protein